MDGQGEESVPFMDDHTDLAPFGRANRTAGREVNGALLGKTKQLSLPLVARAYGFPYEKSPHFFS